MAQCSSLPVSLNTFRAPVSASAWAKAWSSWDFDWERLKTAYGWTAMTTWACLWIIPFWVLLGQRPKKTTWILGPVATIVLFGFWLDRFGGEIDRR